MLIFLCMHKTLPTLGNEAEQWQIKFYKKLSGELIFSQATKNLEMFYFTCRLGKCSKSKVTAVEAYLLKSNVMLMKPLLTWSHHRSSFQSSKLNCQLIFSSWYSVVKEKKKFCLFFSNSFLTQIYRLPAAYIF